MLAFDEDTFDLSRVPPEGIWVSKILTRRRHRRYRVSISTTTGRHFDLQLIISKDTARPETLETIYWLMAIASYPFGPRVVPRVGCCRPEMGARSLAYHGDLTVWEKIREYSSRRSSATGLPSVHVWQRLLVRGLGAFLRAWNISGRKIVPGQVTPDNVVVPDLDFREGAIVTSLTGWVPYENTLSLVRPMLQNFFRKTAAHYPWYQRLLDPTWICDAYVHVLGPKEGGVYLARLLKDMMYEDIPGDKEQFTAIVESFLDRLTSEFYVPLPLRNAVDRYGRWLDETTEPTSVAREQLVFELFRLYRIDRFGEISRYYLYRHTYFRDCETETLTAFDELLTGMYHQPGISAIHMVELSRLQSSLSRPEDRAVFSRLVFPRSKAPQHLELLARSDSTGRQVIVRTRITDRNGESYTVREPLEPAEIGQLYRQFFRAGYPKTISERDRFLLVVDADEQVVGGLCYRLDSQDTVHLDGSTISPSVSGRGIGTALLEDFCTRMANFGMRVVKTHFFLRRFYSRRGFEVDQRWGALVRFLDTPSEASAE
jgi:GNAT superfamily N-acetyltransferase